MRDVDTLIRDYVEAAAPPVTAEEILAPTRGPAATGLAPRRRVWWRSPVAVTAMAAVAALVVIGGVALGMRALTGGDETAGPEVVDPVPGIALPIGEMPTSVAVVGDAGFVTVGELSVVRFDPTSGAETGRLDLSGWGTLGVYDGELWLTGEGLRRIDPDLMEVVTEVPNFEPPMAVGHGSIWATYPGHTEDDPRHRDDAGSIVLRLDPETLETTAEISLASTCPGVGDSGVGSPTVGVDAVWVTGECAGEDITFLRIDPATGEVARAAGLQVGERSGIWVQQMLVIDGRVWAIALVITESDDAERLMEGRVYRIGDTDEPELMTTVGRWPVGAVYAEGSVWVIDGLDATVTRIDAATGDLLGRPVTIGVPAPAGDFDFDGGFSYLRSVAVWGDTLWVAAYFDGTLIPVYLEPPDASGPATTSFPSGIPVVGSTTTEVSETETTFSSETETTASPEDVPPGG